MKIITLDTIQKLGFPIEFAFDFSQNKCGYRFRDDSGRLQREIFEINDSREEMKSIVRWISLAMLEKGTVQIYINNQYFVATKNDKIVANAPEIPVSYHNLSTSHEIKVADLTNKAWKLVSLDRIDHIKFLEEAVDDDDPFLAEDIDYYVDELYTLEDRLQDNNISPKNFGMEDWEEFEQYIEWCEEEKNLESMKALTSDIYNFLNK